MRVLIISRGGLELARAHLARPVATIGRSPSCDVVLRAPGVASVQFMLEWVGAGTFDSSSGKWSIFDVSESTDDSGEGVLLGDSPLEFRDFQFSWRHDELEASPEIGGSIGNELAADRAPAPRGAAAHGKFLELVQIRNDTGAVEEVLHLRKPNLFEHKRPIGAVPEFRVRWNAATEGASLAEIILDEMPGAKVLRRGVPVENAGSSCEVRGAELLEVRWGVYRFFIRAVDWIDPPKVRRTDNDPLLRRLSLAGLLLVLLVSISVGLVHYFQKPEEILPPPRVATVEIKEAVTPQPKIQEEQPVPKQLEPDKKVEETVKNAGLKLPKNQVKAGGAAAARTKPNEGPPKIGVNSPAKATDVSTVGILGALTKMNAGPKGAGVRPDMIINEGIITQAASGTEGRVLLKNPPAGSIGTGRQGGSKNGSGAGLAAAGTSLQGESFDPKSVGPIAREGGKSNFTVGSGLGKGTGVRSGLDFGKLDTGSFEVTGGLDKETIRRVIMSYKGHIRTCYERALLSTPKLGGRISYLWNISAAGPVVAAQIRNSDVGSPVLEGCVLQVIKMMKFPVATNGRPTSVIYPFVFQSK